MIVASADNVEKSIVRVATLRSADVWALEMLLGHVRSRGYHDIATVVTSDLGVTAIHLDGFELNGA